MPLDPQAHILLEQLAMLEEFYEPSLEEIRRRSDASSVVEKSKLAPVACVEDFTIDGPGGALPVRLYTPYGAGPFPLLVYFHGGGWIAGNLDMADPLCHSLTSTARCLVLSVAYRLAPEHKFPAAVEDAFAATQWAAHCASRFNGDSTRLAVGGDSAGGHLAAVVTHLARDQQGPALSYQMLLYPSTDHDALLDTSKRGYAYSMNTLERIRFHSESYLNDWVEARHPHASPLRAPSFAHLPPALVVTAEYDYLYEQGRCYAERLQAAGVPVLHKHYASMMHGFLSMTAFLDTSKQALQEIGQILAQALDPYACQEKMPL
jgi:acetyl esterase